MTSEFTIDRDRLARFRAEADAARGERQKATERLNDLRLGKRDLEAELQRHERAYRQDPREIASLEARAKYLTEELDRQGRASAERAAAREHATQLAARLDAYAREKGVLR